MRFFMMLLFVFLVLPHAVIAAESKPEQTRIVTDQKAGEILFIVEGKTVAVLDENGMTVFGRVNYGAGRQDQSVATDAKSGDAPKGAAHD